MIKKMGGDRREWNYTVLGTGNEVVITNKEKPELMVNTFVAVHSCNNLRKESKVGKKISKPVNYRPIALTSHICKLIE